VKQESTKIIKEKAKKVKLIRLYIGQTIHQMTIELSLIHC